MKYISGGSKGAQILSISCSLGKFGKIVCWRPLPLWRVGASTSGEILDPPLYSFGNQHGLQLEANPGFPRRGERLTLKVGGGSGWGAGREGCQWWIQMGAREGHRPPSGPNSFIFMQFSVKVLQNNRLVRPPRGLASFLGNPSSVTGYGSNLSSGSGGGRGGHAPLTL